MPSDARIKVCAYHRRDFDLVVIRSRPHEMQPVLSSLQTPFGTPSACGLGRLDRLPAEIISIILHHLDLLSHFRFRQLNRRARVLSTHLSPREYGPVLKHGPEGFRGLLRARLAQHFNITDLYSQLTRSRCELCGLFGGFLFLPTLTRCCFSCISLAPELSVLSLSYLATITSISAKRLDRLLEMKLHTVAGCYSIMDGRAGRPKVLMARQSALKTLRAKLGTVNLAPVKLSHVYQESQRYMTATAFPYYDPETGEVDRGLSCKGCQIHQEESFGSLRGRDHVFSRSDFLAHFPTCPEARRLWNESRGGTMPVDEPEFTRRGGYFQELGHDGLPR
ncbi:hypothetical protein NM208_g8563 [Fusarium decemcellulare]|uniref:Uncharacterized protein n=1 Tax=Fusarium decemcellulare TaxID=57161 RepID=A0ACC1S4U9_9HYPO|nr:hypothetical protein NM208_g8563 [Fusarium decemcellulare]